MQDMVVEWPRRKAPEKVSEAAERDVSSAIVTPWRAALGSAWWLAPLAFCGALTFFGTTRLMSWPAVGAQAWAPVVAVVALLMTLPAFGVLTAAVAAMPKILRTPVLVLLVALLLIYAR